MAARFGSAKVGIIVLALASLCLAGESPKSIVDRKAVKVSADSTLTIVTPDETERLLAEKDRQIKALWDKINELEVRIAGLESRERQ
jgi:hypothetical protein